MKTASDFAPHAGNVLAFSTPRAFGAWLRRHHASSAGVWIRYYKKDSGVRSITYAQALDEALCWGWIDGQAKPLDERSWLQRYTPRRARSGWSKRNRDQMARLIEEGRMQPSGLAQVDAAKADGRWAKAYDSPSASRVPADFVEAVNQHRRAAAFFRTLNRANLYAIAYRLQTAQKPETRARRFEQLLQMMKDGKKLH
ncbi:MAG: bacteriocin-protection protein, YdeI/OmpD-associated family [Bacteroidetes bacterium 13_1_20CM_4_60_6]|nr:MAG: bacteriocin-protection protein, YdeI/OmpD-associated family [Bacteroidetes bacterium 13_1_20CM_4_60_6]